MTQIQKKIQIENRKKEITSKFSLKPTADVPSVEGSYKVEPMTWRKLFGLWKLGKLTVAEAYQREYKKPKWGNGYLVDIFTKESCENHNPMHIAYVGNGNFEILDGQHRLFTRFYYLDGNAGNAGKDGKKRYIKLKHGRIVTESGLKFSLANTSWPEMEEFAGINEEFKLHINAKLDEPLHIIVYRDYLEDELYANFLKLNQNTPLNAQQKRKGQFGEMSDAIRSMSSLLKTPNKKYPFHPLFTRSGAKGKWLGIGHAGGKFDKLLAGIFYLQINYFTPNISFKLDQKGIDAMYNEFKTEDRMKSVNVSTVEILDFLYDIAYRPNVNKNNELLPETAFIKILVTVFLHLRKNNPSHKIGFTDNYGKKFYSEIWTRHTQLKNNPNKCYWNKAKVLEKKEDFDIIISNYKDIFESSKPNLEKIGIKLIDKKSFTISQKVTAYVNQNGKNPLTDEETPIGSLQMGHRTSRSSGGTTEDSNLVAIDEKQNLEQGTEDFDSFKSRKTTDVGNAVLISE